MPLVEAKFSGAFMTGRFKQTAVALSNAVIRAEQQSALALKTQAIKQSSGGMKTAEQQKLARQVNAGRGLYSKASPMPPMDPAILNAQTGFLSRHWQTAFVTTPDGTSITLYNTAVYAKYLALGTAKMIARPIIQRVYEIEAPARIARLKLAQEQALK
jgi:hypothetical protein